MNETMGITGVSRGLNMIQTPPSTPAGEHWRYGTGLPFQVSSTQAAILANIHCVSARSWDYETGTDVILFDDPKWMIADGAIAVSRNHKERHPRLGEMMTMVKYPLLGGFIPLGAKRADGSSHPHAGTGFGMCYCMANDVDEAALRGEQRDTYDLTGDDLHAYFELSQLSFDGGQFHADLPERVTFDDLVPGVKLTNLGPGGGIVDGDDLLLPMVAGCVSGVVRWRHGAQGWRPISFTQVPMGVSSSEPSLIRDVDGSLLFTVRPADEHLSSILVWRSRDGGASWEIIIQAPNLRQPSPVGLLQAADGTPYIACNQSLAGFINYQGHIAQGQFREILCLWPLNGDRTRLLSPFFACVPRYEYGPPRHGNEWYVDHPIGATLRLADGQWHHLLCYRIMAIVEGLGRGLFPPTPHSGLHVSKVCSAGPARAAWLF
ncbi:MAG: glycoside hydrolase [Kiritimatiellae bacterium]|nr:glycoside hydrolase [Kiritimatiellia bacterium]